MPQADFYVLAEQKPIERFACEVAHKAWQQKHQVYLLMPTRTAAEQMDNYLWTYQDISFLPHSLVDTEQEDAVTIGWPGETPNTDDVLINLSQQLPEEAEHFNRIIEIVGGDASLRNQARARYKDYRDQGFELNSHDLSKGK